MKNLYGCLIAVTAMMALSTQVQAESKTSAENIVVAQATSNADSNNAPVQRRERPDFENMSEEERKAWREKRRAEIEEMRANMPPPKEPTAAEKAERKAKREKRRAEIEKMRANMPPPKELTEAEKAERKARREKRRAEIEKMRAENGAN